MSLPEITLYTDGACSPNPGAGGWGVVFLRGGRLFDEINGAEENTTNNRMELTAALKGLQTLKEPHRVTLVTDSTYVKNGITSWIHGWQRRGWVTADKQPVKNRDLWQKLAREVGRHRVAWQWVKGHSDDPWNQRVDALAVAARETFATDAQILSDTGIHHDRINIFSGITYAPSRGIGSWAVILSYRQHIKVLGGSEQGGSANRFHLQASVAALSALKNNIPVTLYTTSGYLRDGLDHWLAGWQQRGWLTGSGKAVRNRDLWQELAFFTRRYDLDVRVVRREGGFCLMQEAKELAREWRNTLC